MRKSKKVKAKVYRTYAYNGSQDPIIGILRTRMNDMGLNPSSLSGESGVSTSTYSSWFITRKTKRPQYSTVMASVHAMEGVENINWRKSK